MSGHTPPSIPRKILGITSHDGLYAHLASLKALLLGQAPDVSVDIRSMKTPSSDFLLPLCCDLRGKIRSVQFGRRNGRVCLLLGQADWAPENRDEESDQIEPDWDSVSASSEPLTIAQRRAWVRLVNRRPVAEIAREEGVTRAAIYDRIHRMCARSHIIRVWWELRQIDKHD